MASISSIFLKSSTPITHAESGEEGEKDHALHQSEQDTDTWPSLVFPVLLAMLKYVIALDISCFAAHLQEFPAQYPLSKVSNNRCPISCNNCMVLSYPMSPAPRNLKVRDILNGLQQTFFSINFSLFFYSRGPAASCSHEFHSFFRHFLFYISAQ